MHLTKQIFYLFIFIYLLRLPQACQGSPISNLFSLFFSLSVPLSLSLSSVSVDLSSHLGGTAVPACSASVVGRGTWAPRTTSQMTSTAPLRRATAAGAPCFCRAASSAAAVPSAKPALGRHGSCCPPTAKCTAP